MSQRLSIHLKCSHCKHLLLSAVIFLEADTTNPHTLIVEELAMVCPSCQRPINSAIDDLTRELTALLEERKDES